MKKYVLLIGLFLVLTLIACSKKDDSDAITFSDVQAHEEGEDGWVYFFSLEYDISNESNNNSKNIESYHFDAVNTKYKEIKDNGTIVYKDEKQEEIDYIVPNQVPWLSMDTKTRNDVAAIWNYFDKMKFSEEISLKDLDGLSVTNVDKNIIVRLFNKALKKNLYDKPGKYMDLQDSDTLLEKESKDGYKLQVNFINDYGYITLVTIHVIYDNGTYLSDKIKNKTASQEEIKLQNTIDEIESKIVKEQKFTVDGYQGLKLAKVDFDRLYESLKFFEDGKQSISTIDAQEDTE